MNIKRHLRYAIQLVSKATSWHSRWVVSCSQNYGIRVWNTHDAELHCEVRQAGHEFGECQWFDFSPVGNCLAQFRDSQVSLWRFKEVLD